MTPRDPSEPIRIGINIGAIDGPEAKRIQREAASRIPDCPGAMLRLSREEHDAFSKCGVRFETHRNVLPPDERGDVRVSCRNQVMSRPGAHAGSTRVDLALCALCHGMEERQRMERRGKQP